MPNSSRGKKRPANSRSASAGPAQAFVRRGLVVLQFAFALGLAGAAALLGRTLVNLRAIPTGFDLDHMVLVEVDPRAPRPSTGTPSTPQADAVRVAQYVDDGVARLAAAPGVRAAAYARVLPLDFGGSRTTIAIDGYTPAVDEDMVGRTTAALEAAGALRSASAASVAPR